MSDYKTANLKPETMERLRNFAVGDESVDSAVGRALDLAESDTPTSGGSTDIPTDLREQLDRIESSATTAEQRTGTIEQTLEQLGGR